MSDLTAASDGAVVASLKSRAAARPASQAAAGAYASLAALRGAMVLLVVAHHVATAYAGIMPGPMKAFPGASGIWGAFPIVGVQHSPVFLAFIGLNDTFFMALLFLISGVFAAGSLERRGAGGFAASRLLRLGIPFLIGAVLLAPLAYFPAYMQITGHADVGDFVNRWIGYTTRSSGPAWFLWVLLAFDLLAAALTFVARDWAAVIGRMLPDGGRRPLLLFLVLTLLSAAAYTPMAAAFGSSHWTTVWPFTFQTSRIFHYAVYFLVGAGLGAQGASLMAQDGGLRRGWWIWPFVAILAAIAGGAGAAVLAGKATGLSVPVREVIGGLVFAPVCAALSFLCLAIFSRFVRRSGPFWKSLQANSYGIFLVHYVFVNWVNYALLGSALNVWSDFAIAAGGAIALSWMTAALLRRLPVAGRVL